MSHALYRMGGKRPHSSLFKRRAFCGPTPRPKHSLFDSYAHEHCLKKSTKGKRRRGGEGWLLISSSLQPNSMDVGVHIHA